jgi:hypothetical protein
LQQNETTELQPQKLQQKQMQHELIKSIFNNRSRQKAAATEAAKE